MKHIALIVGALLLVALIAWNAPRCAPGQTGATIGGVFKLYGC